MFCFPDGGKAPQLRKTWIDQIGRREEDGTLWKPPKDARVCRKHFKDDCFIPFEENKDARGRQRKKLDLRPRAYPTEYLNTAPPQISNIQKRKQEIHRPGPPDEHNYAPNPGKHFFLFEM